MLKYIYEHQKAGGHNTRHRDISLNNLGLGFLFQKFYGDQASDHQTKQGYNPGNKHYWNAVKAARRLLNTHLRERLTRGASADNGLYGKFLGQSNKSGRDLFAYR